MSKIAFRAINFRKESLERIAQMRSIVDEYLAQGLRLTARQLYYQFVARDFIPNTQRSYKALTGLLADARYAGMIDWDAIEDRGREAARPSEWKTLSDLVDSAVAAFRLPRWETQEHYVELWVEKQALAGVLEPIASEYHITLMVNKGYSSASAMFAASQRFLRHKKQKPLLLYLGDHDPSGEDMVRDIEDRLVEFGVRQIDVKKIALTMPQVEEYDPPPNPAKTTDSRFEKYAEKHGDESWEVDALPPNVLAQLIRDELDEVVDRDEMDKIIQRENVGKSALRQAAAEIEED